MPASAPQPRPDGHAPRAAHDRARRPVTVIRREWRSRLEGRELATEQLARRAARSDIVLLPQRRMPLGRGAIDLLAAGPGGVTVVSVLLLHGRVAVTRAAPREPARLLVGGRDHTSVVDELERRVNLVRRELTAGWRPGPQVRGAICVPGDWELAPFAALELHGIVIDGAETIARVIGRRGSVPPAAVRRTADRLRLAFPSAGPRRYAA
jgi:hypothetical protein